MVPQNRAVRAMPLRSLVLLLLAAAISPIFGQKEPVPSQPQPTGNCTHPDPATRPDCPAAIAFLTKFQDAIKRNDQPAVASLVHYPLLVTVGGKRSIRSRADLLANFNRVFNASVRAAILNATADDVWGNSHGFMIGRGVIWFDGIVPRNQNTASHGQAKYPFRLITVNPALP